MSEVELKPCPFCGGNADFVGGISPHVYCEKCFSDGPVGNGYDDAAAMWNTRASGWISVDGARELPIGCWVVLCENEKGEQSRHIANAYDNHVVVGGYFYFDMPKVVAYQAAPEVPSATEA